MKMVSLTHELLAFPWNCRNAQLVGLQFLVWEAWNCHFFVAKNQKKVRKAPQSAPEKIHTYQSAMEHHSCIVSGISPIISRLAFAIHATGIPSGSSNQQRSAISSQKDSRSLLMDRAVGEWMSSRIVQVDAAPVLIQRDHKDAPCFREAVTTDCERFLIKDAKLRVVGLVLENFDLI